MTFHALPRRLRQRRLAGTMPVAVLLASLIAGPVGGQQPAGSPAVPAVPAAPRTAASIGAVRDVSLEEALRLAEVGSEPVRIAAAGARRAQGQLLQARSQYLPQVSASASYTRTLATQFESFRSNATPVDTGTPPTGPDTLQRQLCTGYYLRPDATPAERQAALERVRTCTAAGGAFGGIDLSQAGFGAENQYNFGLSFSQNLLTDGRVQAQNRIAQAGSRTAGIELTAQRAQLAFDVTQAYYDAVLADRLVLIAESSLVQAEAVFRQASLARQVGTQSEFDLLRAQVTRDNQLPIVIQNRTQRDLARLRLKQLVNVPLDDSLRLTTELQDADAAPTVRLTSNGRSAAVPLSASDTAVDERSAVRQAEELVRVQEANRRIAAAQRLPSLILSSQYGRVAFPTNGVPTSLNDFATNWTVTVGAQLPLFTGGRIRGDQVVAKANVDEARARLDQAREFARLDARQALAEVENATAGWRASAGTTQQAQRAFQISEVRYREGISTQIELTDSRILLQNALANRALAARTLQVARVRLALLRDLPLGAGGGAQPATNQGTQGNGTGQQSTPLSPPSQQQPSQQQQGGVGGVGTQAASQPSQSRSTP